MSDEKKKNGNGRKAFIVIILTILLITGGYFLYRWVIHRLNYVSTDDAQVRGNIVGVSTKVAARVLSLDTDEGKSVKKGELIAGLDDSDLKELLKQSEAEVKAIKVQRLNQAKTLNLDKLEADHKIDIARDNYLSSGDQVGISLQQLELDEEKAKADVSRQEAAISAAKAQILQAQASSTEADADNVRSMNLFKEGAISKQASEQANTHAVVARGNLRFAEDNLRQQMHLLEAARSNLHTVQMRKIQYHNSQHQLSLSGKNVKVAQLESRKVGVEKQNLKVLDAKLKEAEAKVEYNKIMMKETRVYAPVSGVTAKRNINLGEMTTPGSPLFYVLDTGNLWITANVEEGSIERVKEGAEVEIHLDAYPHRLFKGVVQFIGAAASSEFSLFPSDNPSGNFIKVTHRIPVRIKVEDPDGLLKPGMNAVVDIKAK